MQQMANFDLILASNVNYHFRFAISAYKSSPEPNFKEIGPEIKKFGISLNRLEPSSGQHQL